MKGSRKKFFSRKIMEYIGLVVVVVGIVFVFILQLAIKFILNAARVPPETIHEILSSFIFINIIMVFSAVGFCLLAIYVFSKKFVAALKNFAKQAKKALNNNFTFNTKEWDIYEMNILAEVFRDLFNDFNNIKEQLNKREASFAKEVAKKNKDFALILKKTELSKKDLERQRLATLNILEDISEAKEEMELINKKLKEQSFELETLKSFSDALTAVFDIDEALDIVVDYLAKAINFGMASFVIFDPDLKRPINYTIYIRQPSGNKFIQESRHELEKFLSFYVSRKNKEKAKTTIDVEPRLKGKKPGKDKNIKAASTFMLPLIMGDKLLGGFHVALFSLDAESQKNSSGFFRAMAATLSVTVARLQTLTKIQQSKTEALVRNLSEGVLMFDEHKTLVLVNESGQKILGLKNQKAGLNEIFSALSVKNIEAYVDRAIKDNIKSVISEVALGTSYYEVTIVPVKNHLGKAGGGAVVFHDITHLKEVDQMKIEFVSVASHQLRTPLTAIKLFSEMLLNEQVGKLKKEQKEYLENVYRSTERMVRLVNDLLNLSRLESGRLKVEPKPMYFSELIRSTVKEIAPVAEAKKIRLQLVFPPKKLKQTKLDETLMRQVVHNLVANAVHYTPPKGSVEVKLATKGKNFLLTVKDSGIGIPKEAQGRMFEKFFRADNAVKAETEGTGLGLYVIKMIMEISGGKVWFESEQNKGTSFFISLPLTGMKKKEGEKNLAV